MIYIVQFKVEVNDEYAPYQRDEVADMMQNLEGILDWDIIDEQESERLVNGYKEHIVEALWKSERPMGFDELSEDVCSFEIGRFDGKLCELIRDGYVRKANGKYALTRRCIESIGYYGGCMNAV